ncbi:upf0548 protein [Quercus suber]|uniref:Upf0548 protein n=1 Tax=Quercus suber TaxID=58331 RepID=A0AAW0JWN2_QUESU|nr:upf0548 protein [Quercus suber]
MVFLCWARPSPQEQKACINKSCAFNYDAKFRGPTAKPLSCLQEDKELSKDGFLLNHARVSWLWHFGLDWAFVDSKTPIQNGVKFCVCLKEFLPWMMMPLQVVYVNDKREANKAMMSFGFGSGTLQGHLLIITYPSWPGIDVIVWSKDPALALVSVILQIQALAIAWHI